MSIIYRASRRRAHLLLMYNSGGVDVCPRSEC